MKAELRRRALLATGLSSLFGTTPAAALPKKTLVFPRDRGAHPEFRTEWWYVTGQAAAGARAFGFQVTFFRSRVEATQERWGAAACPPSRIWSTVASVPSRVVPPAPYVTEKKAGFSWPSCCTVPRSLAMPSTVFGG